MSTDPNNQLLEEWQGRTRKLGKYEALHHTILRRIVAELDEAGNTEAADVIQSLVWAKQLADNRNRFLSDAVLAKRREGLTDPVD